MEQNETQLVIALKLIDPILQFLLKATRNIDVPLSALVKAFPSQHRQLLSYIPDLMRRGVLRWEITYKNELHADPFDRHIRKKNPQLLSAPVAWKTNDNSTIANDVRMQHEWEGNETRILDESVFIKCLDACLHPPAQSPSSQPELEVVVGFPYKQKSKESFNFASNDTQDRVNNIHGCTQAAMKRRLKQLNVKDSSVLSKEPLETSESVDNSSSTILSSTILQDDSKVSSIGHGSISSDSTQQNTRIKTGKASLASSDVVSQKSIEADSKSAEEKDALTALMRMFCCAEHEHMDNSKSSFLEASYAGYRPERNAQYQDLSASTRARIPHCLLKILNLKLSSITDISLLPSDYVQYNHLYTHQARAVESIFAGVHTLICTGTGSGKSLCFLLPILSDVIQGDVQRSQHVGPEGLQGPSSTALLLFPTKALAQDQLSKLSKLLSMNTEAAKHCRPGIIDGDTPHEHREAIANECNIILTNPDTLHANILPGWKKSYKAFLSKVRYIAIDELHLYAGTFGSHVRMVLSRLLRVCCCSSLEIHTSYNWVRPTFVGCSATVAYPEDHFRFLCPILTDDSVCILDSDVDGSPCSRRYFFLWNPPVIEQSNHLSRRHAADETAFLLAQIIKKRIRCIAFCATRMIAEWVFEKCSALLNSSDVLLLEIYRGGYSSEVRRKIEQRLFHNEIIAVVATSALEVGVDIGGIDVTLHCGYPGSFNSLMQQAGRAGRDKVSNKPSFSITVCFNSPAEQHLWKHPKSLLTNNKLRPSLSMNTNLIQGHLLCAAAESPLAGVYPASFIHGLPHSRLQADTVLFGGETVYEEALQKLLIMGSLIGSIFTNTNMTSYCIYNVHPSAKDAWKSVSLRSIEPLNYSIVDLQHPQQSNRVDRIHHKDAVLDTIPYSRVFYHAYPGAIIVHRGHRYKITSMTSPPGVQGTSWNSMHNELIAFAVRANAKYSTAALSVTTLTIVKYLMRLESTDHDDMNINTSFLAGHGVVNVKRQVHGYKKLSLVDRSELSRHEIRLPPMEYDTNALWIDVDASKLRKELKYFDEGVHALSHALVSLSPVFVPCSYSDVDCDHSHFACTRILLYDTRAGGSGTCARLWDQIFKPNGLIESAIDLLTTCPSRCDQNGHGGGCPSCIQAVPCSDFQNGLSKSAAVTIAKHLLHRIKTNDINQISSSHDQGLSCSPRRKRRLHALQDAADLERARERSILIGRPSWPTDE